MRITAVDCWLLQRDLDQPLGVALTDQRARYTALVRLRTDEGHEGWGEGLVDARLWPAFLAAVTDVWAPMAARYELWDGRRFWRDAARSSVYWERKGLAIAALGAVDIALWDLRGKVLDMPVCRLLGGEPRPVPVYASDLFWDEPEALAEKARRYADAGFPAVKMHVGRGPAADLRRVRAVREAIGPDVGLMVDLNCGYSRPEALDLAYRLEELNLLWLEEPLSPDDLAGCADLRRRAKVPLAIGENEYTIQGFREILTLEAADYLMPDPGRTGGLSEFMRICTLAEAFHVPVSPHNFAGPVVQAASLHAMAAAPSTVWMEWDVTETAIRDEIVSAPHAVQQGMAGVDDRPGLGVDIVVAALDRWAVAHLEKRIDG